jgi:hypothetical protein
MTIIKMGETMTMMIRKLFVILLSFFIPLVASSQKKDFGIWYGISAQYKLTKKLEINLSTDIRTFNNASKIEEGFLEGGVEYSIRKYLTLAARYRLNKNLEDNNSYYFQHKLFFDVKGILPAGNFSFSSRFRFQSRMKTYIKDNNDNYPDYTGIIKLKAIYKTPTFPIDPYVYAETFLPMFSDKSGTAGKNRFAAGAELKITKRHSVETEYIFQRDYQPHLSDINIISVNYNIKF